MKSLPPKKRTLYQYVLVVALILTIAGGWVLTGFLVRISDDEFKLDLGRDANLIVSVLRDNLEDVDNAAKVLSQGEPLVAALSSGSRANIEHANRVLDRYKSCLEMSICYLLDGNGLTVASSNRNEVNSFVGKSFAMRPFVKGALAGRLTSYFALGLITRERGYFVAAPVVDSSGRITGVVVIKKDITPIEEAFRKNPQAYLVSPEGIIFITSSEKLLFRAFWPVDEKRRSELMASGQFGKITFGPLLSAEPRSGTYVRYDNSEHYLQRIPFGSDGWSLVFMKQPHVVANYRWFGILLTVVFELMLLLFYVVLRNKEKSLEGAKDLLKAEGAWERTFDAVPDLIAIIDTDHRIINMNRAMAERIGISQQDAAGRRCHELVHGSQELPSYCPYQKMFDSGKTECESLFEKNLNGDFIITTVPILAEDGTIESSIHLMHDVTDHKRLINEVNRINNLESIGLLAGGLAHDFNNLLNIIYGNITFAKMHAEGNMDVAEPLTDAEEACERARELGIRLQTFSQMSLPAKEPIALAALIEDAAEILFKGSNISHSITAAVDLLPVEADPEQIRRLFDKLLTNAKEAMSDGGTVKIDIEYYVDDGNKELPLGSGSYVCIALQDDGKGIPEEQLPKIFDPYFSTKDTYSQRGLGLGLSICHSIAKRHSGHISVESELGIGTRVTVYLPAAVDETKFSPEG